MGLLLLLISLVMCDDSKKGYYEYIRDSLKTENMEYYAIIGSMLVLVFGFFSSYISYLPFTSTIVAYLLYYLKDLNKQFKDDMPAIKLFESISDFIKENESNYFLKAAIVVTVNFIIVSVCGCGPFLLAGSGMVFFMSKVSENLKSSDENIVMVINGLLLFILLVMFLAINVVKTSLSLVMHTLTTSILFLMALKAISPNIPYDLDKVFVEFNMNDFPVVEIFAIFLTFGVSMLLSSLLWFASGEYKTKRSNLTVESEYLCTKCKSSQDKESTIDDNSYCSNCSKKQGVGDSYNNHMYNDERQRNRPHYDNTSFRDRYGERGYEGAYGYNDARGRDEYDRADPRKSTYYNNERSRYDDRGPEARNAAYFTEECSSAERNDTSSKKSPGMDTPFEDKKAEEKPADPSPDASKDTEKNENDGGQ